MTEEAFSLIQNACRAVQEASWTKEEAFPTAQEARLAARNYL
jgi:hypothetical protein